MCLGELPWKDHHHQSSFLPNLDMVEHDLKSIISTDVFQNPKAPIFNQDSISERNLGKTTLIITIDILV